MADTGAARMWKAGDSIDRYELVAPLGRGGMGEVWRANHKGLRAPVALKLLLEAAGEDSKETARLLREARAAAKLRGPHVVQVFDVGIDEGTPYIAMELLEGESLQTRLTRGALSAEATAQVMRQVSRAVARAHREGIVHRDLKPANIHLVPEAEGEVVKVLDFGIAKLTTGDPGTLTDSGAMLGTPFYMSPEQLRGGAEVGPRSDLWAMGVIAYECLVGERPFRGETMADLVMKICADPPPVPSEQGAVPAHFDAWFARATAREPEDRFGDADELAAALDEALGSEAPPGSLGHAPPAPAASPKARGRVGRGALLAAVSVGVVGAWMAWAAPRSPAEPATSASGTATGSAASASGTATGSAASASTTVAAVAPGSPTALTFDGRVRAFALAPDGERVAYVVPEGEGVALYLKDPGGEPRRRRTFSEVSRLRFSPDGEVLLVGAGVGAGDVVLPIALAMSAADGAEANGAIDLDAVTRADWAWDMAWAADGGSYAALPQTYVAEVVLHDRDGTRRQVVPLEVPAAWRREDGAEGYDLRRFLRQVDLAPGGDEVLVVAGDAEQGDLLLQPIAGGAAAVVHLPGLSIRHARYAGARRVVLAQVEDDAGERRLVRLRLAADGQLVGEPEILLAPFRTALPFDLSRDGRRVAFVDAKWRAHLFRYDREGEGLRRRALTSGTRRDERPALSPDGRRVAFIRQQGGLSELHAMPSEGGPTRRLSDLPAVPVAPAWSPDGETLAFVARDEGTARVWLLRGDAPAVPLEPTVPLAASREIAWAPGPELLLSMGAGINVAVVDPVKGRLRLLLDDPAPVAIRSARWASDGRIAAFRAGREWGLALLEGAAWRTFAPRRVSPILGFAPDGEAVLVLEGDRVSRIDVKTGAETLWGDLDVEENAGVSVATDARSAIVSVRDSIRDVERVDLE